jgi:hypothetical protein
MSGSDRIIKRSTARNPRQSGLPVKESTAMILTCCAIAGQRSRGAKRAQITGGLCAVINGTFTWP